MASAPPTPMSAWPSASIISEQRRCVARFTAAAARRCRWKSGSTRLAARARTKRRFARKARRTSDSGQWPRNALRSSRECEDATVRIGPPGMTYCCGILVREGLVMIADTRTNAGLDNISTFRKLHIFRKPGERIMAIATSGNLAISQSVISTLSEGLPNPETGELETLMNAPTMFKAAQRLGAAIRAVIATEGKALQSEDINFDVSFLFGGQIKGSRM